MHYTSVFSIGGLAFALQGQLPVEVEGPYRPFFGSASAADVVVRVGLCPASGLAVVGDASLLYDTGDAWSLHSSSKGYLLRVPSLASGAAAHCQALVSDDLTSVDLHVVPEMLTGAVSGQPSLRLEVLMYPLAELLLIWLLARRGGILVHGAGVVDGGHGYLFAGNSGHGKTTMARLWPEGTTILNDDRIVVRPHDGRFWMYGTPWHGDYRQVSPGTFPIRKIFFLTQSPSNFSRPRPAAQAATLLLTRSFLPIWDRAAMDGLLASCEEVASAVPCHELGFRAEPSIVDYVRGLQQA